MPDYTNFDHRHDLFERLSQLPKAQLNQLIRTLNPPPANISPQDAQPAQRIENLLEWVESGIGCGLETLEKTLETIIKKPEPVPPSPPLLKPHPKPDISRNTIYLLLTCTAIIAMTAIVIGNFSPRKKGSTFKTIDSSNSEIIVSKDRILGIDYNSDGWLTLANRAGEANIWKINGHASDLTIPTGGYLSFSALTSHPKKHNTLFYVVKDGNGNQSWIYQGDTDLVKSTHVIEKICRLESSKPADHYLAIDKNEGNYMVVASNDDERPRIYVIDLKEDNSIRSNSSGYCQTVNGSPSSGEVQVAHLKIDGKEIGNEEAKGVRAIEINFESTNQFITAHKSGYIFVWEVGNPEPIYARKLQSRSGEISSLSLSQNGLLAVGFSDGTIDLYSYPFSSTSGILTPIKSVEEDISGFITTEKDPEPNIGTFVDFSKEGELLVSAGKTYSHQFCLKFWKVDEILKSQNTVQPYQSYFAFGSEFNSIKILTNENKIKIFGAGKDDDSSDKEYPYSLKLWDFNPAGRVNDSQCENL